MDPCAELTLRLLRIAQEALEPNSSLVDWMILPLLRRADWHQAAQYLTAATKPVLVAPILEPGCFALWSIHEESPGSQRAFELELDEQRRFLTGRLDSLCLTTPGFVETPDTARVLVRRPGGGRPPVGWIPPAS